MIVVMRDIPTDRLVSAAMVAAAYRSDWIKGREPGAWRGIVANIGEWHAYVYHTATQIVVRPA